MRGYLIGILLAMALVFDLSGIRGDGQESLVKFAAEGAGIGSAEAEGRLTAGDDQIFAGFGMTVGEVPLVLSSTGVRGLNLPRHLKFVSPIHILSSQNTPLLEKGTKNQYFHYHFTEASYRYFVYSLRRIRI